MAYLWNKRSWITSAILVLFPKVIVAVLVRTFRSIFGQLFLEMGLVGKDGLTALAAVASEHLEALEQVVLNTTVTSAPQIVGAGMVALLAACIGSEGLVPALPP